MFTGLVQVTTKITSSAFKGSNLCVLFRKPKNWKLKTGESVAINGICSTFKKVSSNQFEIEYMDETIKKTTVRHLKPGSLVNLELPLKLGDRLGGHLVQGHVDAVGQIISIKTTPSSNLLKVSIPKTYKKFIVRKGSITIDGVSLTIVDVDPTWFSVSLINYTLNHTTLNRLQKGDLVNLEFDIIGKYINQVNHAAKK